MTEKWEEHLEKWGLYLHDRNEVYRFEWERIQPKLQQYNDF